MTSPLHASPLLIVLPFLAAQTLVAQSAAWRTAPPPTRQVTATALATPVGDTVLLATPATTEDLAPTNGTDAVAFEDLQWVYGGFHPSTNCVHDSATLSGLSFSRDGLRFSYVQDLSAWGLEYGAADALACLFVLDNDGRWVGGKFDWISSSRTTRDFKNVYSGYAGWSLHNVPNPCTAAFVIVSRDGRKRSNVLSAIWQR